MTIGVGFVFGFLAVVFVQQAAAQTVHVVGDTTGWTIPQGGAGFYSNWASKNNFLVGDSLTFNFGTNAHDVVKVTKESFDACNSQNAIGNVITTGPATVKLDTAGVHYFICTVGSHCQGGQKLSVTVVSATSGGAVPPSSNTPPTTATTPSHNDACAPTPANSPSNSGRSPAGAAPAPSSSTAVITTLYVTFFAIVMSFLF